MAFLFLAIVIAASGIPSIMAVDSLVAWTDWSTWKHIAQAIRAGSEDIPTSFLINLGWAVASPIISLGFFAKGVANIATRHRHGGREDIAFLNTGKRPADKPNKVEDTTATATATRTTEATEEADNLAIFKDGFVETAEGAEPAQEGTEPHQPERAKGPGIGQKISDKLTAIKTHRAEQQIQRDAQKRAADDANPSTKPAKDRPVRMSRLKQEAREIARDTRAMVQDTLNPEDVDERPVKNTEAPGAVDVNGPAYTANTSAPKFTFGWFKAKLAKEQQTTSAPTTRDPDGEATTQHGSPWRTQPHDGPEAAGATGQSEPDSKTISAEILSFYAVWTSAGQTGRTPRMRKQARRLAAQVSDDVSGHMVTEHGMRGFAALNTLRAAAGVDETQSDAGHAGPAKPMPQPSDEDLMEADALTGTDEDDAPGNDTDAEPAATTTVPKGQEQAAPTGFELDDEDLAIGGGQTEEESTYDARDGYSETNRPDTDMGVLDTDLVEDEDNLERTDVDQSTGPKSREDTITRAAEAFTKPATSTDDASALADSEDGFENVPEEAFEGSDEQRSDPNGDAGDTDNADDWGDDPDDYMSGAVNVIDDIGRDDEGDEDEDDDWKPSTRTARQDVKNPTTGPTRSEQDARGPDSDDTDHEWDEDPFGDDDLTEPDWGDQDTEIADIDDDPTPSVTTHRRPENGGGGSSPLAIALEQQIDSLVDYQTKAYAWEQLGENPPEEFDTEEKRKTFLRVSATAIVSLRRQIAEAELERLRTSMTDEKIRWMDSRADIIMDALLRGAQSHEAHAQLANDHAETTGEWIEYSYQKTWSTISPAARDYRNLALKHEMRFFKSAQTNPSPPEKEQDELYDVMDVLLADPRTPGEEGGFRPGMMGIAFAIIPAGNWTVQSDESAGEFEEKWILVGAEGQRGKVRLRDRSIAIFREWVKHRGRRPMATLHVIIEDGAQVNGENDGAKIVSGIERTMGDDRGIRVVRTVWSDKEWVDRIMPEILGAQ